MGMTIDFAHERDNHVLFKIQFIKQNIINMFLDFIHYHGTQNARNFSGAVRFLLQVRNLKKKTDCFRNAVSGSFSVTMHNVQEYIISISHVKPVSTDYLAQINYSY